MVQITKFAKPGALLIVSTLALTSAATGAFAQAAGNTGYLQDTRGGIVRTASGLCVRTGSWAPSMAVAECDPDLVPKPKPAAPTPKVAPPKPAAAPKPAPAPPAKPKPAAVAPATLKVTLQSDALFDFDKAVIRPDARTKLDDLVGKIKGVSVEVIIVVGHTDRIGSDAYNMKLSVRRAEAVKAYLASKGIPANRIRAEGKGERQPVKQCKNTGGSKQLIACLEPNRRVEIEVVGTRQK